MWHALAYFFKYFFAPCLKWNLREQKDIWKIIRRAQNSQEQSRTGFILCFLVISMSAKIETQKNSRRFLISLPFFFIIKSAFMYSGIKEMPQRWYRCTWSSIVMATRSVDTQLQKTFTSHICSKQTNNTKVANLLWVIIHIYCFPRLAFGAHFYCHCCCPVVCCITFSTQNIREKQSQWLSSEHKESIWLL